MPTATVSMERSVFEHADVSPPLKPMFTSR